MTERDQQKLDQALDILQAQVPDRLCRVIRWLRNPRARMVRLPLGVLCVVASFFWFLPILGLELLPLGLLLIAIDVPFFQRPVATATLWLEQQWLRHKFRRSSRARR
ncbi:hypothetical protein ACVC7V_15945 [Hydrogenophaga sp. A37]|uniref:hypothetical protein n=1 Tax=Hydrogenophaga sp. A37 TaxID=1945864 RepID=UPI000985E2D8|nr:hypothetical protein [Hydrogenophaga sp. A37]OOG89403.1 hypothetical protein B0E41_00465 [Hydrogenophaga sp. A37]